MQGRMLGFNYIDLWHIQIADGPGVLELATCCFTAHGRSGSWYWR